MLLALARVEGHSIIRRLYRQKNVRFQCTQRLRIVDASIFPKIPGFFIVSSVYMVGEKASEVILADV